ncbi:AsnC family transcriptional regulator [Kordiimonas sediminis]|uniref:AsnC family transcriptional regulator n=1 Tax=Kordiimonas sediminis TaxID=1735581 RepID=A0A919AUK7_9PROT|nr:Lrp/AsnC family transcriptional regulator [Kordiimonas sediminis]GHF26850.1 AsnC family transcriptional regulator [Kordiimonas sediminis]
MRLDAIDYAILEHLQENGRISNVELADSVGLSESACLRRVKILHDNNVIEQYSAHVNPSKVGLPGSVFVSVTLDRQQEGQLGDFERQVRDVDEVMECYLMSGEVDYMIRVAVADATDYERIHNKLTRLPGVSRIHSSFALRTILKRNKLPVSPEFKTKK